MKIKVLYLFLILAMASCISLQAQTKVQPLNNDAVVKLVRAGFKDKTIIAIIRSRPVQFDLSPDKLISLKHFGVSEQVILTMLARDNSELAFQNDLEDDTSFGEMGDLAASPKNGKSNEGGFDIFGSGSGTRSRSRSSGPGGANTDDTQTTGSATVRIIKPPSESGEPPKLEKTPTLTNDPVVDLVEAGFSEGTIVRRIEQSPAGFDLSPSKLAELHRKRVSDRIIEAMTTAMGGVPSEPGTPPKTSPEK
jgi:hypothetical protein